MQRVNVSLHPESGLCVAYDVHLGSVVHEITDYCVFMADDLQRKPITLHYSSLRLARFWSYLLSRGKTLSSVNDALLTEYRSAELAEVTRDSKHRGSKYAARQTVNQKLATVLGWLVWLQVSSRLPQGTIGPLGCRVTARSARPLPGQQGLVPGEPLTSYLYLEGAGAGGSGPYVSHEVFERALEAIMTGSSSDYIAHRDSLFIDIARTAGFRRGSICSLRVNQFPRDQLERWELATFPVKPSKQKRDYEIEFEIPLELALRVLDFIDGPRQLLVDQLRARPAKTRDSIFLSQRDGRPMLERSMTSSISRAMRAAGATKGQAIHVLRGLFMTETVLDEGEARRVAGLDTSTMSIALATAWNAGQKNATSIIPYVAQAQSRAARKRMAAAAQDPIRVEGKQTKRR